MLNDKKIMAFIPARGGSKRLPRKNVLPLAGKPLINWSIEAGKKSQYIDRVFVSTDDKEIADVACQLDAELPELRPAELASDTAKTEDVLLYSLKKFAPDVDVVVLLQPTSPLRTAEHIDEALELFMEQEAFSVVSVTPCEHPPLWSNTLPKDNSMGDFIRPEALSRSQDISQYYRLNGAIYIFDVKKLREHNEIRYTSETYAYVMDNDVSFDIDTEIDFDLAQFFMERSI
ncbi:acylneuraminate cytidylyltransferase family protein [Vibrio splendidus]|uniref:acylneuraminate cytidylyltransferase family protein n=1 Tax=Vibrio splendidus TaxID=29497 RepID=UPI000C863979|nr:acylneuraminate cytidylyltransferase family protein [Vibrio splendidus]PMO92229.1 CMP-N-acetlyneuraminic acid synthetase [Vibrio splendidus]PMP20090.1 CMP-N-acetlyneuraminic acid synthetase [Vibrio splendidus]PMP34113.1 CMP-N-acetlyneuraminic acid synthetase [Vibrio splendidus]PMP36898.1 CMP-N-acetlyneuraminic acid synthetase [Vibrio splendidus]PMP44835.1 CMP-N-acetlyneuraminic acid synthetase [Vibrio splendidus]